MTVNIILLCHRKAFDSINHFPHSQTLQLTYPSTVFTMKLLTSIPLSTREPRNRPPKQSDFINKRIVHKRYVAIATLQNMGWFQPKLGYLSLTASAHLPFVTYNKHEYNFPWHSIPTQLLVHIHEYCNLSSNNTVNIFPSNNVVMWRLHPDGTNTYWFSWRKECS